MRIARVIAEIPIGRVDVTAGDGSSRPVIGDIVELDHGFTAADGQPMGIVFCFNADRSVRWVADVMDSEIELLSVDPRNRDARAIRQFVRGNGQADSDF